MGNRLRTETKKNDNTDPSMGPLQVLWSSDGTHQQIGRLTTQPKTFECGYSMTAVVGGVDSNVVIGVQDQKPDLTWGVAISGAASDPTATDIVHGAIANGTNMLAYAIYGNAVVNGACGVAIANEGTATAAQIAVALTGGAAVADDAGIAIAINTTNDLKATVRACDGGALVLGYPALVNGKPSARYAVALVGSPDGNGKTIEAMKPYKLLSISNPIIVPA